MIAKAFKLGYDVQGYTHKQNLELILSILKTESYLAGYKCQFGSWTSFKRWVSKYEREEDALYNPGVSIFLSLSGDNIEMYT